MVSFYTIKQASAKESYPKKYDSNPRDTKSDSVGAYGKIAQQKKVKLEQLKEQLDKENKEYEATLQRTLQEQENAYRAFEDNFIEDPLTHQLNLAYIATTTDYKSGRRYGAVKGSFDAASVNFNKNKNAISFDSFAAKGLKYNEDAGQDLAKYVARNSVGFTGYCSRHVRKGLQSQGLCQKHTASAYQMGGVLAEAKNKKGQKTFQEVSASSVDLKKLPAGCVLVYDKGAAGYSSAHGHIEVTLGDGTACSDGRTYNIRKAKNMRVFVPVTNS